MDGKAHDFWGVAVGVAIAAFTPAVPPALFVGGGCIIGTLWFSPDLDTESKPYHRWGWLKLYWLPYQKNVKHRSVISHSPIIGTAGRLLYCLPLAVVASVILEVFRQSLGLNILPLLFTPFMLFILFLVVAGIEISCWVHLLCDGELF
jgi:uncharacterized metal-binding protein